MVFRVDASVELGAGHVMRCLTLAEALRDARSKVLFLTREIPGNALELIRSRGFAAHFLADEEPRSIPQILAVLGFGNPVDWLVVDHYRLDRRWEAGAHAACRYLAVIDDLADRAHECDVLLDQNYYVDADSRYRALVPPRCRMFLGPRFALLRKEFYVAAARLRSRSGAVERILVSFGATDPTNETSKVLSALRRIEHGAQIDVVLGATNPRTAQVEQECASLPGCRSFVQTAKMAELMSMADLAVGAGGVTTWERCLLGLPAITVAVAENQVRTTTDLAAAGATWYMGEATELSERSYELAVAQALRSPERLRSMATISRRIMGPVPAAGTYIHPLAQQMLEASATQQ